MRRDQQKAMWAKNTDKSWRRKNDSMIISYRKTPLGSRNNNQYNIIVGRDVATAKSIDQVNSVAEARRRIAKWKKAHPVGFRGEVIKTYDVNTNRRKNK